MNRAVCNNQIDYSQVSGDKVLPFVFTLNLNQSVLYPEEGQKQKFCYDVQGVGQDTSNYADLSHFLLGICSSITQNDIAGISVIINGEAQTAVWGENVEIKTSDKPDNPSGCVGLKFDFPLNKTDGEMSLCITMAEPFAVGPVNVCLFGGNTTATGLMICGPACCGTESCESVFYQKETVCVPVMVTPFAKPGTVKATCCGQPQITQDGKCTGGKASCTFIVTQTLCIEIPISFGAVIESGTAVIQCKEANQEPCNCSDTVSANSVLNESASREERRLFYRR